MYLKDGSHVLKHWPKHTKKEAWPRKPVLISPSVCQVRPCKVLLGLYFLWKLSARVCWVVTSCKIFLKSKLFSREADLFLPITLYSPSRPLSQLQTTPDCFLEQVAAPFHLPGTEPLSLHTWYSRVPEQNWEHSTAQHPQGSKGFLPALIPQLLLSMWLHPLSHLSCYIRAFQSSVNSITFIT